MQYQQRLAEWLSHAEKQILLFNDLPIHPKVNLKILKIFLKSFLQELTEQSEELADFVNEISMQAPLLGNDETNFYNRRLSLGFRTSISWYLTSYFLDLLY